MPTDHRRWEPMLHRREACSIHLPSGGTFWNAYPEWDLRPESIPTDPEQEHHITCAACGRSISFHCGMVFRDRHGASYVCKPCALNF